jgi:CRP-like cAMP-binding protein
MVTALTKCTIARISKADITRVIHEEPAFAELFISHLSALQQSCRGGPGRSIVQFERETLGKESRPEPIIAKVSQETLAEMIGTTRSRVSFFMNKFRKLGFIEYNGGVEGGIEVHSSLLNVVLHDQPQIEN